MMPLVPRFSSFKYFCQGIHYVFKRICGMLQKRNQFNKQFKNAIKIIAVFKDYLQTGHRFDRMPPNESFKQNYNDVPFEHQHLERNAVCK